MRINYVFVFLASLYLASCGGGSGSDNPSPAGGGGSSNSGQAVESVVEGNSITLKNVARFTVGSNDSSLAKDINIKISQSSVAAARFNDSRTLLDIEYGQDREVVISLPKSPSSESFIKLEVPEDIHSRVTANNALVIYYEKPNDEDEGGSYHPLRSSYNESDKAVTATIPEWIFFQDTEGLFIARLKLAIAASDIPQAPSNLASKRALSATLTPPQMRAKNRYRRTLFCLLVRFWLTTDA